MKSFNRERFLYWLLGAVLGVNALFFGYGLFACSQSKDPHLACPDVGARFDNYSEKALAAVLGLIAGAGAVSLSQRRDSSSDGPDGSLASPPPQLPQQPSPEDSLEPAVKSISPNQAKGPAPVSVPVTVPAKDQGSARGRARG